MSDNKQYYYIKLKADFFDREEIILLQNMNNGYKYLSIFLKLILRSLKLMFNNKTAFDYAMLSEITRHSRKDIEKAVEIFKKLDLIETLTNGTIYINSIQNFIGKSSTEADRKRIYRNRIDEDKKNIEHLSEKCLDKNPPEIELELKKELKLDNQKTKFKELLEFKKYCIKKYKNEILTNCCPSLIVGNQLKINENGYLESFFNSKKIDISPQKAKNLWNILFENQEVIGLIKDTSIQKFIGNYIKIKIENKLTNKLEELIYQIHDYKEEENKYRHYFKELISKQIGISNKLYILEDIEKFSFTNIEES